MGRVPRDRVPWRSGSLHPEPRPEAAGPLFPGIARLAARAAAQGRRDRWRDRDRDLARSRLRRPPNAAASRCVARGQARERDTRELRRLRSPRLRRARPDACAAAPAPGAPGKNVHGGTSAPPSHADDARSRPCETRSEEHTSELQSLAYLVCRLLLEKKKQNVRISLEQQTEDAERLHRIAYHVLCLENIYGPPLRAQGDTHAHPQHRHHLFRVTLSVP